VSFSGDRGAAGARILVDGVEIGRLPTKPGDWATAAQIADSTQGLYGFYARVHSGPHRITAITLTNDTLTGPFESHESADVFVSTASGRVRFFPGTVMK
jgi:hypothetical protein